MGDTWTMVGFATVAAGAFIASAAILFTLWGRKPLAPASTSATFTAAQPERVFLRGTSLVSKLVGTLPKREDADLLIGRTLIVAQRNAAEIERAAQARADEIVANAEATASNLLQAARDDASLIAQKTRGEADAVLVSAKQRVAAWSALLKSETDRMVLGAYMAFREAQRSVEQDVKALPSELERRVADWTTTQSDGTQEISVPLSGLHAQAMDPTVALARGLAPADEVPVTLNADIAVATPAKNGHT